MTGSGGGGARVPGGGSVGVVERRIDVGGVVLNVAVAGSGSPVLLLHGFPDSWHLWRHQITALAAAGHRVVAPDLRGFGASDRPPGVAAYAVSELLADVVGLLDALDIRQTAVVGHDWGAVLAWLLTMEQPERVSRLVAVSVGHPAARSDAGLAQQLRGLYIPVFLVPGVAERLLPLGNWLFLRRGAWRGAAPGPDLRRQVDDLSRPGALVAALSWYRANIGPGRVRSARAQRRRVGCPTMGVWSSGDPALTESQMTGSARCVDGPFRYECILGAGHWVPVEAPTELARLLVSFLDGESPGR